MKSFNMSFEVCAQNLRKLTGDYRVLAVFGIVFAVTNYFVSWFVTFAEINLPGTGVAPWLFPFAFTTFGFEKVMMFLPLLLLFCDAPFIDVNQPYIISRCSRRVWSIGQIFYIIAVSGIYVLFLLLMTVLVLIGNMDLTLGWGDVINTAAKNKTIAYAGTTGVPEKIIQSFSPISAVIYSVILVWLACIFIGLLIYVVNAATQKNGFGIIASSVFILTDSGLSLLCSVSNKFKILYKFSPISWCSINNIHITEIDDYPTITYAFCGYIILIAILSIAAILISKKQEIKVIQAV